MRLRLPRLNGVEYCAIGIVLLGASLMAKHYPGFEYPFAVQWWQGHWLIVRPVDFVGGWLGSLMVIVGCGRIMFLEGYF